MNTGSPNEFTFSGEVDTSKMIVSSDISDKAINASMLRYNKGKLPMGLVPTSFTRVFNNNKLPWKLYIETVKVLDFGAQKYSAHNWRKGDSWVSVYNSMMRHVILGILQGEEKDQESGLDHWGHVGCNLAFLLEFAVTSTGDDDRFKTPTRKQEPTASKSITSDFNTIENFIDTMTLWLEGSADEEYLRRAIMIAANAYNGPRFPLALSLKVAA